MYSEDIQEELDEKNIETGDIVEVDNREGRLMPKPSSGDPDIPVIKLESGYNIGLEGEIKLVKKRDEKDKRKNELEHSDDRPDILVLHTGGTIASRVSYEEGGVKPGFKPEDLAEMYPELAKDFNIHSDLVSQMLSENMEPGHWQEIAEHIDEAKNEYDGIVVGHGTDTMSYTGAALSFMLKGINTGVLLVGAQRSSDRPSSDASMNLYCAAKFLADTDFSGVGICMHSTVRDNECSILPAHKVRKMHTSRRDAFRAINTDRIGKVDYGEKEAKLLKGHEEEEFEKRAKIDSDVAYIKARPGMKPRELERVQEEEYSGVILEGTGLGHFPVNSFDERTGHHKKILEKLEEIAEDTVVAMTSQCIKGRINMNVYDAGIKIKDAGVISSKDMHPELAYVKLMWSLGNSETIEEVRELFQEDVAGEIEDRSRFEQ